MRRERDEQRDFSVEADRRDGAGESAPQAEPQKAQLVRSVRKRRVRRRLREPIVTRSKGGWRRKPRRITPHTIEQYWPGIARLNILRSYWTRYTRIEEIVEKINKKPAPRPVTVWQVRLMASHLGLRRPADFIGFWKVNGITRPDTLRIRLRKRDPGKPDFWDRIARPEPASLLRKVGRKPKVPLPFKIRYRGASRGMKLSFASPVEKRLGKKRIRDRRPTYWRNREIRDRYRAGATQVQLAVAYGLSFGHIIRLVDGINKAEVRRAKKRMLLWQRIYNKNRPKPPSKATGKRRGPSPRTPRSLVPETLFSH